MTTLVLHCYEMIRKLLVLKANVEPQLRFVKETLKLTVRVAVPRFGVDSLTRLANERDKRKRNSKFEKKRASKLSNCSWMRDRRTSGKKDNCKWTAKPTHSQFPRTVQEPTQTRTGNRNDASKENRRQIKHHPPPPPPHPLLHPPPPPPHPPLSLSLLFSPSSPRPPIPLPPQLPFLPLHTHTFLSLPPSPPFSPPVGLINNPLAEIGHFTLVILV